MRMWAHFVYETCQTCGKAVAKGASHKCSKEEIEAKKMLQDLEEWRSSKEAQFIQYEIDKQKGE